jgi:hypothetical protein
MSALPVWAQITIGVALGAVFIAALLIAIFGEPTED